VIIWDWLCCTWRRGLTSREQLKPLSSRKDGENIFSRACFYRTRSNSFKLREGIFRLNIRKKFFTLRVVKHWNRLRRQVVEAPSLEAFKARLDGALRSLV